MAASRTTPTLLVLVIRIGVSNTPLSSIQCVPVMSPLPFPEKKPAKTPALPLLPRGKIAVTPVRTGPLPTTSWPSPEISVLYPTSTPATSVMAFTGPGVPSNGTPRSRARGSVCDWGNAGALTTIDRVNTEMISAWMGDIPTPSLFQLTPSDADQHKC